MQNRNSLDIKKPVISVSTDGVSAGAEGAKAEGKTAIVAIVAIVAMICIVFLAWILR